jgi:hypothetical protein
MRPAMVSLLMACIVVLPFVAFTPSAGHAQAQKCPASAFKASTAIRPFGALKPGETKTGWHPCGKQITCIGGNFHPKILRQCHWG